MSNADMAFLVAVANAARNLNPPKDESKETTLASRPELATCARCGESYEPLRSDSRFCTNACRQAAYRTRKAGTGE